MQVLENSVWSGMRRRPGVVLGGVLSVLALVVAALAEGDIPEVFGDAWQVVAPVVKAHGYLGVLGLLYLEESGVPLPLPGDVFVMYVGFRLPADAVRWVGAWVLIDATVVLGASNLYVVARRWGPTLVEGRLGRWLHLTPARLAQAERWFSRWGPWALIIGRHVPGGRVPLTLAAGLFHVRYSVFAVSVAVSTGAWAAFYLVLGRYLGPRVQDLVHAHRGTSVIVPAVGLAAILFLVVHHVISRRSDVEGPVKASPAPHGLDDAVS